MFPVPQVLFRAHGRHSFGPVVICSFQQRHVCMAKPVHTLMACPSKDLCATADTHYISSGLYANTASLPPRVMTVVSQINWSHSRAYFAHFSAFLSATAIVFFSVLLICSRTKQRPRASCKTVLDVSFSIWLSHCESGTRMLRLGLG